MVDITMMTKNRMMNVGGFSPSQRVLGFNPFLPGGLLNGDDGHRGQQPEIKIGDLSVERSMKLRKAAAHAFIEADASNSLRRAVASGPRPVLEYDIGEIVYFFRMGADKKLKFKPCYWHGPARIIMIDQPSTIWLSYQSQLVKASPERIRRASMEENMAMSGWLEDLVKLKKDITTEPIRGFLDLSDQPLPEILDDENNPPRPNRMKHLIKIFQWNQDYHQDSKNLSDIQDPRNAIERKDHKTNWSTPNREKHCKACGVVSSAWYTAPRLRHGKVLPNPFPHWYTLFTPIPLVRAKLGKAMQIPLVHQQSFLVTFQSSLPIAFQSLLFHFRLANEAILAVRCPSSSPRFTALLCLQRVFDL